MRAISFLRSAVAEPGRRLNGALLILTVILGVVIMHSMSGSPTSHSHGPHPTSVVAVEDAVAQDGHVTVDPPGATGVCADGCGGHDVAMAMCLMILVALLSLVVPARRLLWRALPAWSVPMPPVAVALRPAAPPSLHELCISRT